MFPDLRGHTLISRTGSTNSGLKLWDPFGQPMNPTTFALGTSATDDTGTVAGYTGWHQAALKQSESAGSVQVIEMGARSTCRLWAGSCRSTRSRAASTTTTSGPTDPINKHDLTGKMTADSAERWIAKGYEPYWDKKSKTLQVRAAKPKTVSYPLLSRFIKSTWHYNKGYDSWQLSIEVSAPGRAELFANPQKFHSEGWNQLVEAHGGKIVSPSMFQQWDCHVGGRLLEWGTFDLEYSRPSYTFWPERIAEAVRSGTPSATCNW